MSENQIFRFVLVCLCTWAFFEFVFPLIAPFAVAFLLVSMFYPLLQRMQKRLPMKKKFLGVLLILPVILIVMAGLWVIWTAGCGKLTELPELCREAAGSAEYFWGECCCKLENICGASGVRLNTFLTGLMHKMLDEVQTQWMPKVVTSSYSCFKGMFAAAGFFLVMLLSVFLLEKEYADFVTWLTDRRDTALFWDIAQGILSYLVTFLKAQGLILTMISILCSVVLSIAGIEYPVLLGMTAGVLDMLPFIGTGIVLVPLSFWQLVNGCYGKMAVCLLLYGGCAMLREWTEPKLIGKRIGIAPVLMLLAIYAGVRLYGAAGVVKGPLALIVIREILRAEYPGGSVGN